MKTHYWFSQLSVKQRIWLFATAALMLAIVSIGFLMHPAAKSKKAINFSVDMTVRHIAPKLGVTGKSLARELRLPLDVSKSKPLSPFCEKLNGKSSHLF